ncbi:TraB/GumN family protein [Kiloniella sp. EL199]|uniref:TraB/GumN family protein n=1 Tax=Kiloniella sp. EL199 TaxID=2107581 RepID=UPI0013C4CD17|nr:TraB/GumN family protein [Kiloniella sp. EL199]
MALMQISQFQRLVENMIFVRFFASVFFVLAIVLPLQTSFAESLINGDAVLWKIEGQGAEESYIYGTLNSSDRRIVDAGAYAHTLLRNADYLMVDILDDDAIKQKLFSVMLYNDNRRLRDLVSPETFEKIKVIGYEYGYLARQMNVLKPWAARVVFSSPPSEASRISLGIRTLNQTFQDIANEQGIDIVPLQTIEEQLQIADALNEADQIALLDTLPAEIQTVEGIYQTRINNFLSQSSGALYQEVLDEISVLSPEAQAKYMESLVFNRNRQMVSRMEEALRKGNSLTVIDAIHLPGQQGVLKLLQDKGFTITPVK